MKKIVLLSVLTSTLIMAAPLQSTRTINVASEQYSAQLLTSDITLSIALLGGIMKDQDADNWEDIYGAEFSFKCLFSDNIRSQLQLTQFDDNYIQMLQLSMNPHYIFNRGEDVEFGIGPSFGIANAEIGSKDDIVFTYGLGASIRTDFDNNFFIGVEARYEWTSDIEFSEEKDNLNNAKLFAKIGYWF